MQKDILTPEQSQYIKELGFNEPCIYAWCNKGGWNKYQMTNEPITQVLRTDGNPFGGFYNGKNWNAEFSPNKNKIQCSAPTYSQAFRWLREKYGYNCYIRELVKGKYTFFINKWEVKDYVNDFDLPYEEAESRCLDKLMEIINLNQ